MRRAGILNVMAHSTSRISRIAILVLVVRFASLLLAVLLAFCYALRPDEAAAVTLFPAWGWSTLGMLLVLFTRAAGGRKIVAGLLGVWVVFTLVFAEEPASLMRSGLEAISPRRPFSNLRVVSLNCGGGLPQAAAEVVAYRPDVVLLQEVPDEKSVRGIAHRLFGANAGICYGWDTAILAHGPVVPVIPPKQERFFVAARVALPTGGTAEVVSLRLNPPVVRIDLWRPGCWREHTENRRARLLEMDQLLGHLNSLPASTPLLMGGDFNSPAGDAVPRRLAPRLRDTFASGGQGWGNTALNDFPISRIDQLWATPQFQPVSIKARQTQFSDHRMVVADLLSRR